MKHIDMRQQWVQQLPNKDEICHAKVLGTENDADYFTKVHPRPKHLKFERVCRALTFSTPGPLGVLLSLLFHFIGALFFNACPHAPNRFEIDS